MHICCLDLEGVLLPEFWIKLADHYRLDSLRLTTRDIRDFDELMQYRLKILKKEKIRLRDIQRILNRVKPLPGAVRFLDQLRERQPVIILSDTFYEFGAPLMRKLGNPSLFCNSLKVSKAGYITGYSLRKKDGKREAVQAFKKLGFFVKAAGDSYNDLTMLKAADRGILFNPPDSIRKKHPKLSVSRNYKSLLRLLS